MDSISTFEKFDELRIDQTGKQFLNEAAKWAKFLSILGFVGISLMVVAALIMVIFGTSSSALSTVALPAYGGIFIFIIYLIIAIIYFFPLYYLYNFSTKTKIALDSNNQKALNDALEFLKSHYKFMGIMALVGIGIYVLIFITAIFSAALM